MSEIPTGSFPAGIRRANHGVACAWRLALGRFERDGVLLPRQSYGPELVVTADCASSDGVYCNQDIAAGAVQAEVDAVCPSGLSLVSYDRCCD